MQHSCIRLAIGHAFIGGKAKSNVSLTYLSLSRAPGPRKTMAKRFRACRGPRSLGLRILHSQSTAFPIQRVNSIRKDWRRLCDPVDRSVFQNTEWSSATWMKFRCQIFVYKYCRNLKRKTEIRALCTHGKMETHVKPNHECREVASRKGFLQKSSA